METSASIDSDESAQPAPAVVPATSLCSFVQSVLVAVGVTREHASIVADCLVTANLMGTDSHGVVRLAHYVRRLEGGTIKAAPNLRFEQRGASLGVLDGDDGLGHVVMHAACTKAMELAGESGSGAVFASNSSHFGMAGHYVRRLAAEGYAGMVMTATDAFLIPFGAREPFFGTNPLAIGVPAGGDPVVLDMATTSIPFGRIVLARTEGRPIPSDWGFDEHGVPTTDPDRIVGLHPIAGAKGSGLAMVIDVFSSLLSGMPWGPHINAMYGDLNRARKLGHFAWALDIKRIMPLAVFKERLGEMLQELGALSPAEGFDKVRYPGQIEAERYRQRTREGIPVDAALFRELAELGERLNVAPLRPRA